MAFDSTAPTGDADVLRDVALVGRANESADRFLPSTALVAMLRAEPESCHQIAIPDPILDNRQTAKLRHVSAGGFRSVTLPMLFRDTARMVFRPGPEAL